MFSHDSRRRIKKPRGVGDSGPSSHCQVHLLPLLCCPGQACSALHPAGLGLVIYDVRLTVQAGTVLEGEVGTVDNYTGTRVQIGTVPPKDVVILFLPPCESRSLFSSSPEAFLLSLSSHTTVLLGIREQVEGYLRGQENNPLVHRRQEDGLPGSVPDARRDLWNVQLYFLLGTVRS